MSKLVAIGNRAFVVALTGIGAAPVRCASAEAFENALRRTMIRRDVDLVFVPEPMAEAAPDAMSAFRERSAAVLLALPLVPSEDHPSLRQVRYLVEQATGASLI